MVLSSGFSDTGLGCSGGGVFSIGLGGGLWEVEASVVVVTGASDLFSTLVSVLVSDECGFVSLSSSTISSDSS